MLSPCSLLFIRHHHHHHRLIPCSRTHTMERIRQQHDTNMLSYGADALSIFPLFAARPKNSWLDPNTDFHERNHDFDDVAMTAAFG